MPSSGTSAKGAARREEILAAALRTVSESGFRRTSLRGIARTLGLEPAHLLYYFDSREHLLREVVERWDSAAVESTDPAADALEMYVQAIRHNRDLRAVVHLYLAFATEAIDPHHPAHTFFLDRFATVIRVLAEVILQGQQTGRIRSEIEPERTARLLIALADGLQLQSLISPDVDAAADLEAAIDDLFTAGVRSRIAPHPESHDDAHERSVSITREDGPPGSRR